MQRDPVGQVDALYAELDDDLSTEARSRMEAWWTESSKERSGPGTYDAATFGLDPATIRKEFAFYNERFGIPVAAHTETLPPTPDSP